MATECLGGYWENKGTAPQRLVCACTLKMLLVCFPRLTALLTNFLSLLSVSSFLTAEECAADSDLSFLIPVAVGVALGFLIIAVFVSYMIGRRKSRTGYQSV